MGASPYPTKYFCFTLFAKSDTLRKDSTVTRLIIAFLVFVIVCLCCASWAAEIDKAQAQETHVLYFPMVYNNFRPARVGCELPDDAECRFGPPFSAHNLP
jgi:hypothetical protein